MALPSLASLTGLGRPMGSTAAVGTPKREDFMNDFIRSVLNKKPDMFIHCSICLKKIRLAQVDTWTVACDEGHVFHRRCLRTWWTRGNSRSCPTCRKPPTMEALKETKLDVPAAQGQPSYSLLSREGLEAYGRGRAPSELRLHSDANNQDLADERNRQWSMPERRGLAAGAPAREREEREERNQDFADERNRQWSMPERRGLAAGAPARERGEREPPDDGPPVYTSIGPPPLGPAVYQSTGPPPLGPAVYQSTGPPPADDGGGLPSYQSLPAPANFESGPQSYQSLPAPANFESGPQTYRNLQALSRPGDGDSDGDSQDGEGYYGVYHRRVEEPWLNPEQRRHLRQSRNPPAAPAPPAPPANDDDDDDEPEHYTHARVPGWAL